MPDLEAWLAESDPVDRLRVALNDLYRFYAEAEPMLTLSGRDRDALPAFVQLANDDRAAARVEAVLSAWPKRQHTPTRRALVSHALAFTTWRSLCLENGLPARQAVDAVVRMVAGKTVGARE
jgi:hypothetical protein